MTNKSVQLPDLRGKVTLVSGASRGIGRGVALVLGSAGATVYVTGRSRDGKSTEDMPGSVDQTARDVTAAGGQGIAVPCDHTRDQEVEELFSRIEREQRGRLDLLVNNAWGGYEQYEFDGFSLPFWEQPLRHWEGMFQAGLRAHLTASRLAAPIMIARQGGLIINTVAWDRGLYLGNLFYDLAKAATVRMAWGMAFELRAHGVAALALAPGFVRTERVMAAHARQQFPLDRTESPAYTGRAVAFLAADSNVMERSGQVLAVGDLARQYGFVDIDGRQPPAFRIDEPSQE
ncbi:MAG: SDR family NAD(P)-dependent oxidoreductase [Methanothrix sp.]|nr:SDR family NAD(P)-dependent oxidoreductase [Methanothrix sp.]